MIREEQSADARGAIVNNTHENDQVSPRSDSDSDAHNQQRNF